jgi:hypothetical protein
MAKPTAAGFVLVVGAMTTMALAHWAVSRWWKPKDNEVRQPSDLNLTIMALAFFPWLAGFGLYLQLVQKDSTGAVPLVAGLLFFFPGSLSLWQWSRWRLWVEADGLRQRRWLAKPRFLCWNEIVLLRARRSRVVIETTSQVRISIGDNFEGLGRLVEAAQLRSIPLIGFTEAGWAITPIDQVD